MDVERNGDEEKRAKEKKEVRGARDRDGRKRGR